MGRVRASYLTDDRRCRAERGRARSLPSASQIHFGTPPAGVSERAPPLEGSDAGTIPHPDELRRFPIGALLRSREGRTGGDPPGVGRADTGGAARGTGHWLLLRGNDSSKGTPTKHSPSFRPLPPPSSSRSGPACRVGATNLVFVVLDSPGAGGSHFSCGFLLAGKVAGQEAPPGDPRFTSTVRKVAATSALIDVAYLEAQKVLNVANIRPTGNPARRSHVVFGDRRGAPVLDVRQEPEDHEIDVTRRSPAP